MFILALIPGALQVLGYFFYIKKSLRDEVAPNATTWAMFAYGTAFLTILEWDSNASFSLLLLPIICAVCSLIVVALIIKKRGRLRLPTDWQDRYALSVDIILTLVYIGAGITHYFGGLSEATRLLCVLILLLASNTSTVVSFIPLARETLHSPEHEHYLPWLVWSLAYASLALTTYVEVGFWSVLMVYPFSNMILHGSVGILALRKVEALEEDDKEQV